MKKILLSLLSFLSLVSAQAFCGFGTPSVPIPSISCSCPSNKVAVHRTEESCQELCISRGQLQHYFNQGWETGCCPAARFASQVREQIPMRIYPNPLHGTAILEFNAPEERMELIRILDATGRTVMQTSIQAFPGGNRIPLPTESLAPGMYYLWLESSGNNDMLKIIVQ